MAKIHKDQLGPLDLASTDISDFSTAADARIALAVLDDLSDVTETTITSGDLLRWNGTAWVNYADSNYAAASHTHAASDVTSGTFADARIAQSNVTQHQAALSITESQISDLGTYQAQDAGLTSIAGLVTAADQLIYTTALDTYATSSLTPFARTILDDADAATVTATIGVDAAGTDNSTNVTLAGAYDYLTLSGQRISQTTRGTNDAADTRVGAPDHWPPQFDRTEFRIGHVLGGSLTFFEPTVVGHVDNQLGLGADELSG